MWLAPTCDLNRRLIIHRDFLESNRVDVDFRQADKKGQDARVVRCCSLPTHC